MISPTEKFKACVKAFENIKRGIYQDETHRGQPITPALVSKEAGLTKSYLHRKRKSHRLLVAEIDQYNKTQPIAERGSSNAKLKADLEEMEKDCLSYKELYEQALARELILFKQVCELEKEISQFKKL